MSCNRLTYPHSTATGSSSPVPRLKVGGRIPGGPAPRLASPHCCPPAYLTCALQRPTQTTNTWPSNQWHSSASTWKSKTCSPQTLCTNAWFITAEPGNQPNVLHWWMVNSGSSTLENISQQSEEELGMHKNSTCHQRIIRGAGGSKPPRI